MVHGWCAVCFLFNEESAKKARGLGGMDGGKRKDVKQNEVCADG